MKSNKKNKKKHRVIFSKKKINNTYIVSLECSGNKREVEKKVDSQAGRRLGSEGR
jgi:hypothetical protein